MVDASARRDDGAYRIPGAADLVRTAFAEVEAMLVPLAVDRRGGAARSTSACIELGRAPTADGDAISAQYISRLTAAARGGDDSLHLIVMDAHRELNRLAGDLASESIAGASVYGIEAADRPLVHAFAQGVQRTERLRFDHPGPRDGGHAQRRRSRPAERHRRDRGARRRGEDHPAHRDSLYTDVHLARLLFLQRMLAGHEIRWEDTRSRSDKAVSDDLYHLAVGRFDRGFRAALEAFLELLGSRMVFLIDWNRARKRLRRLVGNRAAVELLDWAARARVRAHGLSAAGGDQLVYDALTFAAGRGTRAGESLIDVLGQPAASLLPACRAADLLGGPARRTDRCRWSATRCAPS